MGEDVTKTDKIYDTVNFVKFTGIIQGEKKEQELFFNIFKDMNFDKLTKDFLKEIKKDGEENINKSKIFIVEMLSEIKALAKTKGNIEMIMSKLHKAYNRTCNSNIRNKINKVSLTQEEKEGKNKLNKSNNKNLR